MSRWPSDPKRYRWFVDGHNAIFAHPPLEALQTGAEKSQARRILESMCDRFAAAHGIEVTVVYDGNQIAENPDAGRRGRVIIQYSLRPDEEADDRIVLLASESVRRGAKVAVVTGDRALGKRLPSGAIRIEPMELFRRLQSVEKGQGDDRPPGDYSDIEAHFIALERARETVSKPRKLQTPRPCTQVHGTRPAKPAPSRSRPPRPEVPATAPSTGPDPEALARKQARGRRKQKRRTQQEGRKKSRKRWH